MNIKSLHFYRLVPKVLADLQQTNSTSLFDLINKCQINLIGEAEQTYIKDKIISFVACRNIYVSNINISTWSRQAPPFRLLGISHNPYIYNNSDLEDYIGACGAPTELSVSLGFEYRDIVMMSGMKFSLPLKNKQS